MTETSTETTEPVDTDADVDVNRSSPEQFDEPDVNAEPKNWRLKYRAAATRAEIAEARVAEQNRLHAERVLATKLADVDDAWVNGADLAELLDDVGLVDDGKVLTFAEELVARKPHLAARLRPVGAPASAVNGDDRIPSKDTTPGWHEVLGGKTG